MSQNVADLFNNAQNEGMISPGTVAALQVVDLGAQIQAGLGMPADDVTASEVVLLGELIDDSGSIRFAGNTDVMRQGVNLSMDSLESSKQKNGILVNITYLNGTILAPFGLLSQTPRLDRGNYDPTGGTPLFDKSIVYLGTVAAKMQEFSDNGVPARAIVLIATDGADCGSRRYDASDVKKLVTDLLKTENYIIAGMGIDDSTTDFRQVFREMGILDEWILTPGNNDKEIRAAFQLFSQTATRASQGGASFSQTAIGGFGN